MTKQEFNEISKRYLDGTHSEEDEKIIKSTLETQAHFSETNFNDQQRVEIEDRMWRNINKEIDNRFSIFQIVSTTLGIAACLLIVFFLNFRKPDSIKELTSGIDSEQKEKFEITNTTLTEKEIKLEDGTLVLLKKNSSLRYDKEFNQSKRVVYLKGEAFFHVARNTKKPFFVYANNLVTKVLGTSFRIKAYDSDQDVTVIVKTGKVTVFSNKTEANLDPETQGMVLTPNQQVVFEKDEDKMMRSLVEKPAILISESELRDFTFKSTSINKIFDAIEKAYGVDIVFDEEILRNCKITTSLSNENLFDKLEVICAAIDANYKVVDAQIIIESHGCY
jgi:transmembrane sensor